MPPLSPRRSGSAASVGFRRLTRLSPKERGLSLRDKEFRGHIRVHWRCGPVTRVKSWTRTCSGDAFGRNSWPAFLKPPTSSFPRFHEGMLFRVDRDDGRLLQHMLLHSGVQILELRVPVRMLAALPRFAVALQRVAEFAQQFGDDVRAYALVACLSARRRVCRDFWRSTTGATSGRLSSRLRAEIGDRPEASDLASRLGPAATTRPPHTALPGRSIFLDFNDAAIDRPARNARHFRDKRHATTSKHARLRGCKASARLLVENRGQRIEALPNQICGVRHASRLRDAAPARESPRATFHRA